jgi:hypothetical protein
MNLRQHLSLFLQGIVIWFLFWLAGLPSYYQQYSPRTLAIGCVILSVVISLGAVLILDRARPATRMSRATWIAFYYTVPFALLDAIYCGWHLGHGAYFLVEYWYLSIFYLTPWLTFPPTAWILGSEASRRNA